MRIPALTSKVMRFHITVELLSNLVVSMVLPLLVLHRTDSMAVMTSNSNKGMAKVLLPVMVKANHLDITKEVAIETN
jgi:hypothetical protein